MTQNMDLALGLQTDPATWLDALDVIAEHRLEQASAAGDFDVAYAEYGRHLERTEVTRRKLYGQADTVAAIAGYWSCHAELFQAVAERLIAAFPAWHTTDLAGRVNDTQPAATRTAVLGAEGPRLHSRSSDPSGAGATEHASEHLRDRRPPLRLVPDRTVCGVVDARTRMVCGAAPHPTNPAGHYFKSLTTSSQADAQ